MGEQRGRTVEFPGGAVTYILERKRVKNINLRIRRDGSVFASAAPSVRLETIDRFVASKGSYILQAQARFAAQEERTRQKSGDMYPLLGRSLPIETVKGDREEARLEGDVLLLVMRDPEDREAREKLLRRFTEEKSREVFIRILAEIWPIFARMGVPMPSLRVRQMKTRWGTCLVTQGIITLNTQLLGYPEGCIRYVAIHEFCHFLHPNHGEGFYGLLERVLPDWRAWKDLLNSGCREE